MQFDLKFLFSLRQKTSGEVFFDHLQKCQVSFRSVRFYRCLYKMKSAAILQLLLFIILLLCKILIFLGDGFSWLCPKGVGVYGASYVLVETRETENIAGLRQKKKYFFFVVIVFGVRVSDFCKSWIEISLVMAGRYARNLEVRARLQLIFRTARFAEVMNWSQIFQIDRMRPTASQ